MSFLKPDKPKPPPVPTGNPDSLSLQGASDEGTDANKKKRKRVGKSSLKVQRQGTTNSGVNVSSKKGSGLSVGGR